MRTFEEALAAARPGRAFSNGTEGHAWTANWCDECMHDRSARADTGPGCPLLCVALLHEVTPAEWIEQPADELGRRSLGDRYHCIEFRKDDGGDGGPDDPDPDPDPPPQVPGQIDMLEYVAERFVEEVQQCPDSSLVNA